ncbi:triggering receptor expressed on myeloid cells 3-like [Echinops telfairi]|uniref:Triggering receptor expressed on myeloid cells 3-like n=1 Tax=Echinops telfairi TaxID=9371 RepID=A0AC55DFZ7_ECHTE|nr:triggering receptor expressed on myeloid cells 3-like [Echinops telfairi]
MRGTGLLKGPQLLLLLLLLLYISGSQADDIGEEQECLTEGANLTVLCPYNDRKYGSSLKAWQRVRSQGPPETLVRTTTKSLEAESVRSGRFLLEDFPTDAVMKVTVIGFQRQDAGLYQCVIDLSPQDLFVLHHPYRLVYCNGEAAFPAQRKP